METYIFDWDRDTTISNFGDSIADLYEHTFVPKLSACANITYVGMASNGNRREAVFKIKNYTSIYIRICKDDRNDFAGTTDYPKLRLSKSADLSTCNSYYTNDGSVNISYGGQATYYGTGNINMKFNMYVVTDTMSVSDAIIGLAMSAGSIPIFLASIGSIPPIHFAMMTIASMARLTVSAIER